MKFEIKGDNLPVVICTLEKGESIFTESGGMSWMTDNFDMNTNTRGGMLKGLGRKLAGESLFMTTYTCNKGPGEIAFASSFPGKIMSIELVKGQSIICQKRGFLAATEGVTIEMHFRKRLGAGFFGGEGFILQKITGPGTAFIEMDGSVIEYDLNPEQTLKVDQGNIGMYEPTVDFDIARVKGLKNILFSGEGLFLATLKGPGKVWLQTMPFSNLANQVISMMPKK